MKGYWSLLNLQRMIALFMDYCQSKQLRPKTMKSYEQALQLFARWLREEMEIDDVEDVKEPHIRSYIVDLQKRGKYTFCVSDRSKTANHPQNRRDYRQPVSNITINNYLRNLRVFFNWLEESDCISKSPMRKVREIPQERPPKEYLEDEEVMQLLKSMEGQQWVLKRIDIIREKRLRLVIIGSITIDCREGKADPMSEAFLQMAGVFSQLELAMIRARVKSGMANAKAKGKKIGRRPTTKEDIPAVFFKHYAIFMEGKMNVSELARVCGLSRPTVYKYMRMMG